MSAPPLLLLLHGLLGSGADWQDLEGALAGGRRVFAPDLPGHGLRPAPVPAGDGAFDEVVAGLLATLDAAGATHFDVLGYSLGGRLALGLACRVPARVRRLVAVGASPGLEGEAERAARRKQDATRARALRTGPLEAWLRGWYAQPMFASLAAREDLFARLLARRETGQPAALADALEALSPGRQPPLRSRLATVAVEALLLAGSQDARYVALGRELAHANPRFKAVTVPGAGHAPHLEAPREFLDAVQAFLARP